MKFITLPEYSFLTECFDVDEEMGELFWKERPQHHFSTVAAMRTFNSRNAHKSVGTVNKCGYKTVRFTYKGSTRNYLVHRLIFKIAKFDPCNNIIDHIDGDRSNNSISNLQIITSSQNVGKMRLNSRGSLMGTCMRDNGKWRSYITVNGKREYLGDYATQQKAHEVYLVAREARLLKDQDKLKS